MIRDAVLFPDAAAAVCTYLDDTLAVQTSNKIPNPRPDQFYRVLRVGGASRDIVIDNATVVVEAWALTDEEADDLAQLARAYLLAIANETVGDTIVYAVDEVGAPANLPDPVSGQPRVTATYTVRTRGAALNTIS